jgi:hypothetical protein
MSNRVVQQVAATLVAVGITASGAIAITAQRSVPAAETIDVQKLGPQVGAAVPEFSLPDQIGQPRTLRSVMGPNGVVLVFFRSADW